MRTTLDLDDELAMCAKREALERHTSLKALVESGLRRELGDKLKLSVDPMTRLDGLGQEVWQGIKADRYVTDLREDWA